MGRRFLLLGLLASASLAEAAEMALPVGTRIRVQTDNPPWTENKHSREVAGPIVRQDENSLTFVPPEGGEPITGTKRGRWLCGELVSSDPSFVTVKLPRSGEVLRVPSPLVSRFEVYKKGAKGRAVAIGTLAGGSFLAVLAYTTHERSWFVTRGQSTVLAAAGGAFYGALLGAGVDGYGFEPVDVPRVRIQVAPVPRGAGGQVTIGF
jgi:hypothetical protein